MSADDYTYQARDCVADETLDLIDDLDADQARSILRCFSIDEENFDTRALATIAKTVRVTSDRSGSDYNALLHFPDGVTARLNRKHLRQSRAMSAETEGAAQRAAEHAQGSAQSSQASVHVPSMDNSTIDGDHGQERSTAAGTPTTDPGDLDFEKFETRRLIRDGHVTINHYYMNRSPEVQPEPKQNPQRYQRPDLLLCKLCNHRYLEEDNVLLEDGRRPCGYHTGKVMNYGNNEFRSLRKYGVSITGRAWNCCRRRPDAAGCHPQFHVPS